MQKAESVLEERNELTVQEGVRLFIGSYAHSQRNTALQEMIFNYYKAARPNLTVNMDTLLEIKEQSREAVRHMLSKPGHAQISPEKIEFSFKKDFGKMFDVLWSKEPAKEPSTSSIASHILAEDLRYMGFWKKRKNRKPLGENDRYDPRSDPKFSYLIYYGLLKNRTGDPVLDKMYTEIRALLEEKRLTFPRLRTLLYFYNKSHSDSPVWGDEITQGNLFQFWLQAKPQEATRA